ncbi:ATP-dependent helicase [Acidovorax sp. BLS4]|uniref:ATP-dependent helicase n=1 Tax=Acidovorax sp. BLS4 TaxID=3273430 RepID=UPI002942672C|nr:ATP-dependent helicase [Paracidovorax avenae]WOI43427.1 ATP-dependent helicase [Paracidovorax avenae]
MATTPPTVPLFQARQIDPTAEQLAIQQSAERTLVIEANAGAAKTTTLALRMGQAWARGVAPERCLALTHTATACQALQAALRKVGVPAPVAQRFRIATFDAFCAEMLADQYEAPVPHHRHLEELRPFVWQAVQRVEDNEHERWREELLLPTLGDTGFVEEFLATSVWLKGTMKDELEREGGPASPEHAAAIGVGYTQLKVFLAYERIRRRELADEPLFRGPFDATYDLARRLHGGDTAASLPRWPRGVQAVLVDEMHDMNEAAFRVLRELLDTTQCTFCGVGDRDQVIYGAHGADAAFMGDAITAHTGRPVARLRLTPSHRFGKKLAAKAGRLAAKPYDSLAGHDTAVELRPYDDAAHCVDLVAQAAQQWRARPRARMAGFAVLLRHSNQSVGIENRLLADNVPYTVSGFDSYLLRPEVLLVRGLLAVATDNFDSVSEPRTRDKLMRALVFFCGARIVVAGREHESQQALLEDAIRSVTDNPLFLQNFFTHQIVANVEPAMQRRLRKALEVAREAGGQDTLPRLLQALQIDAVIREVFVSRQRREDALANLAGLCEAAKGFASARDYFLHLNRAEQRQRELRSTASLVLANIEDVKGLEFDHVVIPFLEQGVFPVPQAPYAQEKNTLYVGMTRARQQLTLLCHRAQPGAFLQPLGYAASA